MPSAVEGAGIEPGHGNQMLRGVLPNSRLDDRDELLATRHGRCSLASMMHLYLPGYRGE
jgi:hypothetical protein